ncbi:serine/threonine-protein kinase [Actinocorallia sp. B10E7]|uniref:serine/threonine-protein kinase n=1 Tax=Actinocorallia sp. B10E7 TaxID=3153558 RepID=UPI00325D9609
MEEWAVPGLVELAELGRGAQGRVVLARRERDGAVVAVKYLTAADEVSRARFRDEAALLARVTDPHVTRLLDLVEDGERSAIVMEYVEGATLHRVLKEAGRRLTAEEALLVLKGSLLGLGAAHAVGVVHRDYKPANVLVRPDGTSTLVDFGVAARTGGRGRTGSPGYMSPEQWLREPVGPWTDVYAATCVFFECLTGRTPFEGDEHGHVHGEIPLAEVPEQVRELVEAGLAKDPPARPANAAAFLRSLDAVARRGYGRKWEKRGARGLAALAGALSTGAGFTALTGGATSVAVSSVAKTWFVIELGAAKLGALAAASLSVAGVGIFAVTRPDPVPPTPPPLEVAFVAQTATYPELRYTTEGAEIVQVSGHRDPAVEKKINQVLRAPLDEAVRIWREAWREHAQAPARDLYRLELKPAVGLRGPGLVSVLYEITMPFSLGLGGLSTEIYRAVTVDARTGEQVPQETFFREDALEELSRRVPPPPNGPEADVFTGHFLWRPLSAEGLSQRPLRDPGIELSLTADRLRIGWHSTDGAEGGENLRKTVDVPYTDIKDLMAPRILNLIRKADATRKPPPSTPPSPAEEFQVRTFGTAGVFASPDPSSRPLRLLRAGRHPVHCKVLGPEVRVDGAYNHWWLRTREPDGTASYFSAYYLRDWGDDEARDDDGREIPDCP